VSEITGKPCLVLTGGEPSFVQSVKTVLGLPTFRMVSDELESGGSSLDSQLATEGVVWVHLVPGVTEPPSNGHDAPVFEEATLLERSARTARDFADRTSIPLTFVAVLPALGLFAGDQGRRCDLASATMDSLMRTEIGRWSRSNDRIVAVTYAGLEGHVQEGQRPAHDIVERTPMKALCSFEQLGDALRFIGSRRAAYITGTVLCVDGGWRPYSWMYPARTI
jgi:hypothetical protein